MTPFAKEATRLVRGYLPWLEEQWTIGQRNGAALWRQLKSQGFRGSLRVVTEWATRRRRAERADSGLTRTPSSRTIARLMTVGRDRLSRAETVTVATIESGVSLLVEAREIIAAFQATKEVTHRPHAVVGAQANSPGCGRRRSVGHAARAEQGRGYARFGGRSP